MNEFEMSDNSVFTPKKLIILLLFTFLTVLIIGSIATFFGGRTLGLLSESLIIVPAIIYVWRKKIPFLRVFRFHSIPFSALLYTLGLSLTAFILGDELDRIIGDIFPMPQIWADALKKLVEISNIYDAVILIFATVILAGFAEEMMFRGIIQRTLESLRDPAKAIVFSAIIFALAHFNPWMVLQITFLGLILGYLAWKSNSILPAILVHGLNNLFSLILMNISEIKQTWYASTKHVNIQWIVVAVVIFAICIRGFNKAFDKNGPFESTYYKNEGGCGE